MRKKMNRISALLILAAALSPASLFADKWIVGFEILYGESSTSSNSFDAIYREGLFEYNNFLNSTSSRADRQELARLDSVLRRTPRGKSYGGRLSFLARRGHWGIGASYFASRLRLEHVRRPSSSSAETFIGLTLLNHWNSAVQPIDYVFLQENRITAATAAGTTFDLSAHLLKESSGPYVKLSVGPGSNGGGSSGGIAVGWTFKALGSAHLILEGFHHMTRTRFSNEVPGLEARRITLRETGGRFGLGFYFD